MTRDGAASAWLTKVEALRMLGKSERSLDRLVHAGKVQRLTRPRAGKTPEPLFNRADLERATAVEAFEIPHSGMPPSGENGGQQLARRGAPTLAQPAEAMAALAPLLAMIVQQLQPPRALAPAPEAPAAPQWLDVDAAAAHSGLSDRLVRALIKSGRLPALKDGRTWKIRRDDLDALRAPAGDRANSATPPPVARTASAAR